MARMVPELDGTQFNLVRSDAEKAVYKAFRDNLGPDLMVLHSLELVARPKETAPVDAEADFVIFDPSKGFLAIEVKGGGISYNAVERKWWSKDHHNIQYEIKDPFRQARNAKYEVLRNLKASKQWGSAGCPRLLIGHAVIFPDLIEFQELTGPDRPDAIIGNIEVLADPSNWIRKVFDFWGENAQRWQPLGHKGMTVVEKLFCQTVIVDAPLALSIAREYQRQIELTERQGRILRTLRHRHRAAIAGGAGTGKTLIALQHAKALASQGLQTLLVCYNRALADFLKIQTEGIPGLHAMSFHQLCDWRLKTALISAEINLMNEAELAYPGCSSFDVHMPYALARTTELDEFRYQAIVVDEGQDFGEEYWLPIELLLENEEDSPFYVFYDPNQAVYRNADTFPFKDAPFMLNENCRNTRNIHAVAYKFYSGDKVDPPDVEGAPPQIVEAVGIDKQARKIKGKVTDLLTTEKLTPQDVTILVLGGNKNIYYQKLKNAGNPIGATWSFEVLWQPGSVLVDTARRFKGLEASVVFLWGIEQVTSDQDKELLYVALSRARSRLFLAGPSDVINSVI